MAILRATTGTGANAGQVIISGEVNTFADLPASGVAVGELYLVLTSTGVIGVNRKLKGLYRWGGTSWERIQGLEANKIIYDNSNSTITATDVKAALDELDSGKENAFAAGTTADYFRGDKTFQTLDKAAVGLGNVDNTSDLNKPISTATQTALDGKEDAFTKNTAFNKNFGSTTGTVCQGDDSRLSDSRQCNNNFDNAATSRTNLGLGTAATLNVGTSANNVVQLDGTAKLPAVDGSQLTNLPGGSDPTQTFTQVNGAYIGTDEIRARDGDGLKLYDDGGTGIFVKDGGDIGIRETAPTANLEIAGESQAKNIFRVDPAIGPDKGNLVIDGYGNLGLGSSSPTGVARFISRSAGSLDGLRVLNNSSQIAMSINGFGNVGIKIVPTTTFDCNGASKFRSSVTMDTTLFVNSNATIGGNLSVTGSVTKGSGSFDIPHPDPKKKDEYRLRHYFDESPTAGGTHYTYKVTLSKNEDNILELPDYFPFLNDENNVFLFFNGIDHFGNAFGKYLKEKNIIQMFCSESGDYDLLIRSQRKDEVAMENFNKFGVEYLKTLNQEKEND